MGGRSGVVTATWARRIGRGRIIAAALALIGVAGCAANGTDAPAVGPDLAVCTGQDCTVLCKVDADCRGGLKCEIASHVCVACLKDADCPADEVCRADSHTCARGCSPSRACPGDGGVCEVDAGACVECRADADCTNPDRPRCQLAASRCVPCLPAPEKSNCPPGRYCAALANDFSCQPGCADDNDCNPGGDGGEPDGGITSHCDPQAHRCITCVLDTQCPAGQICKSGDCVDGCSQARPCSKNLECCNSACTDFTSDALNCGGCGASCKGGWLCCNSACFNPASDGMNCGGCGITCAVAHGSPGCAARACVVASCDPGFADCDGVYKDGCEANTNTSQINCGACGNVCSIPRAFPKCAGGACAIDACLVPWDDCNKDIGDGCEINTWTDAKNCGGCGLVCNLPNAAADCRQGSCVVSACNPGFANCNGQAWDGCEAAVAMDNLNCGGCGLVCGGAHAAPACAKGICRLSCDVGWGDCDMNTANGCEVDLLDDARNCGACGNLCAGPHAQERCNGGMCSLTACDFGFADCNRDPRDGCEVSTLDDALNCGTCRTVCSANHIANPTCGIGLCNGQCAAGFADCNMDKQRDGCEQNIDSDIAHCGACNIVCPGVANGTPGCAAGQCGIGQCNAGFADCDKQAGNGCEVATSNDARNCGGCGVVCGGNGSCINGQCIQAPSCGAGGVLLGNACVWTQVGDDTFNVPNNVNALTVTAIGGGGGGGIGPCAGNNCYYPGGGGGSGYYVVQKVIQVNGGQVIPLHVGAGGAGLNSGGSSTFGNDTVGGGFPGHTYNGNCCFDPNARGGNGGSGGGAGYTNSNNGGGVGSGVAMGQMAGAGGAPSPGQNQPANRGQGFGAGGAGLQGTSGYDSNCSGPGGANGGNGATTGGCGGGGGGAGGLVIPGFNNPPSSATTNGTNGAVWVTW